VKLLNSALCFAGFTYLGAFVVAMFKAFDKDGSPIYWPPILSVAALLAIFFGASLIFAGIGGRGRGW
jgi:hypothetical protein